MHRTQTVRGLFYQLCRLFFVAAVGADSQRTYAFVFKQTAGDAGAFFIFCIGEGNIGAFFGKR